MGRFSSGTARVSQVVSSCLPSEFPSRLPFPALVNDSYEQHPQGVHHYLFCRQCSVNSSAVFVVLATYVVHACRWKFATLFIFRSAGKVYHVLIFHKGGQYSLDIAGEENTPALFSSLDDLVVFCMSHQMKMEGDKVRLPLARYIPSCVPN